MIRGAHPSVSKGFAMILDDLYASEINFRIESDWGAGYSVALGTEYSGYVAQATVGTFDQACEWLREAAIRYYPHSDVARASG